MTQTYWRKCGVCKREIPFGGTYQGCSVSSCRKFAYCSVNCWDEHSGVMNHKSAWAEERRAPTSENDGQSNGGRRRLIVGKSSGSAGRRDDGVPKEVLIVASKLKNYIKMKHDLNTSANVMEVLSDMVRYWCDEAVDKARAEGRKTLMDRDFK